MVDLSVIRLSGVWLNRRTFAADFKTNKNETIRNLPHDGFARRQDRLRNDRAD